MSNEVQRPDSTPDTKPGSAPSLDGKNQLDKEERKRDPETWQGLVMRLAQ